MNKLTPFGAFVDHMQLTYVELAQILTAHSEDTYSPAMAKMICDGRKPVPAYAWAGLRAFDRELDRISDLLLKQHRKSGGGAFQISQTDINSPERGRILLRLMRKLRGGEAVEIGRHIPENDQTFGTF